MASLTPAERKKLLQEPVSPPKVSSKKDTGQADIYTADKGQPPMDDDMGSIQKPAVKKAKGGSISSASARADGCAVRGKTRA